MITRLWTPYGLRMMGAPICRECGAHIQGGKRAMPDKYCSRECLKRYKMKPKAKARRG